MGGGTGTGGGTHPNSTTGPNSTTAGRAISGPRTRRRHPAVTVNARLTTRPASPTAYTRNTSAHTALIAITGPHNPALIDHITRTLNNPIPTRHRNGTPITYELTGHTSTTNTGPHNHTVTVLTATPTANLTQAKPPIQTSGDLETHLRATTKAEHTNNHIAVIAPAPEPNEDNTTMRVRVRGQNRHGTANLVGHLLNELDHQALIPDSIVYPAPGSTPEHAWAETTWTPRDNQSDDNLSITTAMLTHCETHHGAYQQHTTTAKGNLDWIGLIDRTHQTQDQRATPTDAHDTTTAHDLTPATATQIRQLVHNIDIHAGVMTRHGDHLISSWTIPTTQQQRYDTNATSRTLRSVTGPLEEINHLRTLIADTTADLGRQQRDLDELHEQLTDLLDHIT